MKTIIHTCLFTLTTLMFAACGGGENKQSAEINTPTEVQQEKKSTVASADASFVDGMLGKVFQNYLQLKASLIHADAKGAQTAAGNMAEGFGKERAKLKETARGITDTDNLEEQRKLFADFTSQIEPLFKESISSGTIYKQFCPMAFDNQGAYWFSEVKEIQNPYYGDKMLNCGRTEETISKN